MEKLYPKLTQMMDHCLYQDAEPTFSEAILKYSLNGEEAVVSVLSEIDEILDSDLSEEQILSYVSKHSDYLEGGSGVVTLKFIKQVLR